jgi:hypothetical protein
MMQLVAGLRHVHLPHKPAVTVRRGIDIYNAKRIGAVLPRIQHRDVGYSFRILNLKRALD